MTRGHTGNNLVGTKPRRGLKDITESVILETFFMTRNFLYTVR